MQQINKTSNSRKLLKSCDNASHALNELKCKNNLELEGNGLLPRQNNVYIRRSHQKIVSECHIRRSFKKIKLEDYIRRSHQKIMSKIMPKIISKHVRRSYRKNSIHMVHVTIKYSGRENNTSNNSNPKKNFSI